MRGRRSRASGDRCRCPISSSSMTRRSRRSSRPSAAPARAHLEIGTYDAPWIDNIDNHQTDSYPGWAQDGQVSVLRAVTPEGGPIATFDSVPAHGDIIRGATEKKLSADYFGFVRAALDERLGGINVVGPATLGREETPVQVGGIPVAKWFGGVVTSIVGRALAEGALDHRRHGRQRRHLHPRRRAPTRRCSRSTLRGACPTTRRTRCGRTRAARASTRSTAACSRPT